MTKTAFVIYQILVNRENDANKKKRVRLSVEEKIWILNHRKENPLISQNKIALQKLCYEMDQMYIEEDFSFEAEAQDLILVGESHEDEMVTLEFIPEIDKFENF